VTETLQVVSWRIIEHLLLHMLSPRAV